MIFISGSGSNINLLARYIVVVGDFYDMTTTSLLVENIVTRRIKITLNLTWKTRGNPEDDLIKCKQNNLFMRMRRDDLLHKRVGRFNPPVTPCTCTLLILITYNSVFGFNVFYYGCRPVSPVH